MTHKIIFFLPSFKNYSGHENSFSEPLGKVSRDLNFDYIYIVSKKNKINNLKFAPIWESSESKYNFIKLFSNFILSLKNIINFKILLNNKNFFD